MWVYTQNDAESRLGLSPPLGHWLDYYLFLMADETPPLLGPRPMGLRSIAAVVEGGLDPILNRVLIRALAKELAGFRLLGGLLPVAPPSGHVIERTGPDGKQRELAESWCSWLQAITDGSVHDDLMERLTHRLAETMPLEDWREMAFLTRRIIGELSDENPSGRAMFSRVKHLVLYGDATVDGDWLLSVFRPSEEIEFTVEIPVHPVPVSKGWKRKRLYGGVDLVLEDREARPGEPAASLTAIRVQTNTWNVQVAAAHGLASARHILYWLRTAHYVRTHLSGPMKVASQDGEVFLSLPQPFWTKKSGRRAVPALPPNFGRLKARLPPEDQTRWEACRWHVAQSIAAWPEDVYTAASEAWQAVEGLFGTQRPDVTDYLPWMCEDYVKYLARSVSYQHSAYGRVGTSCDWCCWDASSMTLRRWLTLVLMDDSPERWSGWRTPPAPRFLFEPHHGLVPTLGGQMQFVPAGAWLATRLKHELLHLYALRNAVVHEGRPVFGEAFAGHLGRLGLELALGAMEMERAAAEGGPEDGSDEEADEGD